jgi:RNA polymerase sigma factor for flagellar operon FliA
MREASVAQATGTSTRRATPAEAEALWRAWNEAGDVESRDCLIRLYTPMVRYLAGRKVGELPGPIELGDIVSCGLIALIQAIDRFEPAKGATFEQFAWTRVAGSIVDELRRQSHGSRSARRLSRRIEAARDSWAARTGRAPSQLELAAELRMPVRELRARLNELERAKVVALNGPVPAADGVDLEVGDTIEAPSERSDPELAVLRSERSAVLRRAIAALSERERAVLSLHLQDVRGTEIGLTVGVSESRVSQLLGAIRDKLKAELADYEGAGLDAAA